MTAKEKVANIVINAGSGHNTPKPTIDPKVAAIPIAVFNYWLYKSVTTSAFLCTSFFCPFPASNLGGLGLGHNTSPLFVTIAPLAISSYKLVEVWPSLVTNIYYKNFEMLFAYKELDWPASLLGKSVYPIILTPLTMFISPGLVSSQLPPFSEAKSTITDPGFIKWTCLSNNNLGAGLPGISAVVTMISTSFAYLANNSISASMNSLDISLAYPPVPSPSSFSFTSMNSAPRDYTYSLTAALVSNPLTMAPKLLAVAIADKPATPPPITSTLAGGNLPAAVIYPVKNLPKCPAASITALYPAIFAIDDNASYV